MRKIAALILAAALLTGLSCPVLAASDGIAITAALLTGLSSPVPAASDAESFNTKSGDYIYLDVIGLSSWIYRRGSHWYYLVSDVDGHMSIIELLPGQYNDTPADIRAYWDNESVPDEPVRFYGTVVDIDADLMAELADSLGISESQVRSGLGDTYLDARVFDINYGSSAVVKAVQQALNDAGYECGTPDGSAGPMTQSAVKEYQAAHEMEETGAIDEALARTLGVYGEIADAAAREALKTSSKDISYNTLARNPDDYNGERIKFYGKVIQLIDDPAEPDIEIRLAVGGSYDTIIYCFYDRGIVSSRVLEDDYITVYGTFAGLISYQSTMGGPITIPAIIADAIDQ